MSLPEKIQSDLQSAMRGKQAVRLGALRMVKTALTNKQVESGGTLSDEAAARVLETLVKQRRDSVDQFRKAGREEMARKEEEEIAVIESYLPSPATEAEMRQAIAEAIAETGASTPKDMGRVMKAALARLAGKTVDRGQVSRMVQETLSA